MSARAAVERARTAHHEAGHLVIGSVFGFRCASVSIRPDLERGSLGRVIPLDGLHRSDRVGQPGRVVWEVRSNAIEEWLCTLYAGFAAEVRFAPDAEESARVGAWGDDEQAHDCLRRAGIANDTTRHLLRARTATLVEWHWPAIQHVARELLKHEELDGEAAERLCAIARGNVPEKGVGRRAPRSAATRATYASWRARAG